MLELQFNTKDVITLSYATAAAHHAELESNAEAQASSLCTQLPLQPFLRFTKTDLDAGVADESLTPLYHSDNKMLATSPLQAAISSGSLSDTMPLEANEGRGGWFRRLLRKEARSQDSFISADPKEKQPQSHQQQQSHPARSKHHHKAPCG